MRIDENKVVSLSYVLKTGGSQGTFIEAIQDNEPISFIFGSGELLPKLEEEITGLETGNEFTIEIQSDDAYGAYDEKAVVEIPIDVFMVEGAQIDKMLTFGNSIPMQDAEGNHLNGTVVDVKKESVLMDFNHPLAGKDLYFSGKIVGVREATAKELEQGMEHSCSCGENCGGSSDTQEKADACHCNDCAHH